MRTALALVLLMLTALVLPVAPSLLEETPRAPATSWTATDSSFQDGSIQHDDLLCAGCGGSVRFDTVPGAEMTSGTVNLTLTPTALAEQATYSFSSGTLTGTPTNTSITPSGLVLTSTLGGPPEAGNTSQQVSTAVQWTGIKSFDTLHLICNGAVCGAVTGTNLTIYARQIILETGTSISVEGAASSGSGAGSSVTTPANGRSDGGGGGGHSGTGGAGGGTNGGSGGTTYGNGTEMGSPGGDVVGNSNYADAYGGHGGGLLTIRAGSLVVNGSLLANGAGGDAGVSPNGGTGAGGSGGGGGAGGSIDVQVNTLSVGSTGVISANGGAGGDGEDGQQSGIGFGMYDGGDGGGGGGGGYVRTWTTSGGSTSLGSISATAGGGGLKGLKYGTGVDGFDGDVGSAGSVTAGTWPGYATGSFQAPSGAFIGDAIAFSKARGPLWMNHSATVPANSTLDVLVRTSMSAPGTSSPAWSAWTTAPVQNASLGRATFVQMAYAMTRNSTASPSVTDVTFEWARWTTVDGLTLSVDNQPLSGPTDTSLSSSSATLDITNATLDFSLPADAAPAAEGRLWLGWTPTDADLTVDHPTLGLLLDVDTDVNPGADLVLTQAHLASLLSTASSRTASDGSVWLDVTLNLASSTALSDLGLSIEHVTVPWSIETTLSLAAATNASIVQACGSVYLSTTCGSTSSHDVLYATGQGTDAGVQFSLSDPMLSWLDNEPPRLDRVIHRYGGVDEPDVRLGERTVIVVEDLIDESTATVDLWFGTNIGADTDRVQTSWNAGIGGWMASIDTGDHLDTPGTMSVSVLMTDERGNTMSTPSAYTFQVLDRMPEVATLQVSANEGTVLLEGTDLDGTWEGDAPNFSFRVADAGNRSDLTASIDLVRDGLTTTLDAPWIEDEGTYLASWAPGRNGLGAWTIEVHLSEPNGARDSDADGLGPGHDATLHLVDTTAPTNLSISAPAITLLGEDATVTGSWSLSPDEHAVASLTVFGPSGDEIESKGTGMGPATNLGLTLSASALVEGMHRARLEVLDDVGNPASPVEFDFLVKEPVGVFGSLQATRATPTEVSVEWDFQTDQATAFLSVALNGTRFHEAEVTEGQGNATFDLLAVANDLLVAGAMQANLSVTLCHANGSGCLTNGTLLDLTDLQSLGLGGSCLDAVPDGNATDVIMCQMVNTGFRPVTLTWQTTLDGTEDGWAISVEPGMEWTIWEANPAFIEYNEAHRSSVAWNVSWRMTASHHEGPVTVLHEGTFAFTPLVVDDEGQDTLDDATEGASGNAFQFVLIVGLMAVLAGGSLMLTLRVAAQQAKAREDDQTAGEGLAAEEIDDSVPESIDHGAHDPEALAYHADLIEQGYSEEDALTYTRKYFPEFHR